MPIASAVASACFTACSRFLKTRGNVMKMTIAVIAPATKSAIPSDMYTPLNPIKCVSVKHRGIRIITLRSTARKSADLA